MTKTASKWQHRLRCASLLCEPQQLFVYENVISLSILCLKHLRGGVSCTQTAVTKPTRPREVAKPRDTISGNIFYA